MLLGARGYSAHGIGSRLILVGKKVDQFGPFQADLAITAGGLAAYEALCAGTPLMALSYDGFQQSAIRSLLTKSGACIDLGPGDNFDPARLPEKLTAMEGNLIERNPHSL